MFPIIFSRVLTTVVASIITEKIMKQSIKKLNYQEVLKCKKFKIYTFFLEELYNLKYIN